MPNARHVSLVQKLRWHVSGNISPTAFAIGDVDGNGDNEYVIGNLAGELFIFKGNHPEGQPWMTCKGLGTITAVAIGDIRNWGKNSIVVMSAEGLCHIFDLAGLEESQSQSATSHFVMSPALGGTTPRNTPSVYSSTPVHGSFQPHSSNPNLPATPSIRPVPDLHLHQNHHGHHHSTPPLPAAPQNTPHGSSSSSVTGFFHQNQTPIAAPGLASHAGGASQGGVRRGSDMFPGSGSGRTSAVLANLIGTPPPSSTSSHGPHSSTNNHPRSVGGGNSTLNSPTGTPLLKAQNHLPPNAAIYSGATPAGSTRDMPSKKNTGSIRNNNHGKTQVRHVGGQRVLERPNLTLPVPVNINRAHIADIDGDGLCELVLARTDRILHSYSLQPSKASSPNPTGGQPVNQQLNLMKLLSRTSSISTLDSSGLLSPSEDRRETVIHYPSLSSMGRQYYGGPTTNPAGTGAGINQAELQENADSATNGLVLVEKKRWALDGQIHCLAVTKDAATGLPILLVAQPGLKLVMVDHTGAISEPMSQVQRNPATVVNVAGPDTPTRGVGSGDVATDIVCGTQYINGQKKEIIGLMSMDGAFALHDLESNTVKVHDLDSTHKIFGFSKLNFSESQPHPPPNTKSSGPRYGGASERYADEMHDDYGDMGDESDGRDTVTGSQGLGHDDYSEDEFNSRRGRRPRTRRPRSQDSSMLISEPYGSRFQKNDIFVGCSWSGITFFIDQEFNTSQYDFDARVCAFGAGQYAVTPGRNEPCLFYVDFEDNIYVYYNLYIQTEPPIQFDDMFKTDTTLVQSSHNIRVAESSPKKSSDATDLTGSESTFEGTRSEKTPTSEWTERDMKEFIHDSLYNVNRYEDEFQRLKHLADIERAKRTAFFEAEATKDKERLEAESKAASAAAVASANSSGMSSGSPTFIDPRLRRPQERTFLPRDSAEATNHPGAELSRSQSRGKKRGQFPPHEITTNFSEPHTKAYTHRAMAPTSDDSFLSPASPSSPQSPSSPKPKRNYHEKRRSSLLIKDVLSHYEGKITPPLKSPTSPSAASNQLSGSHKSGLYNSSGSATTLTNIMKRFSLKDLGNGGRLSRSSTASSGSSGGSGTSSSQSTVTTQSHLYSGGGGILNKGRVLESRAGKSLRANRAVGISRQRALGAVGRKLTTRSRLSLQQDREDDKEGDDDTTSGFGERDDVERALSDATGETDGDNLLDFERTRGSVGDDEEHQDDEGDADAEPEGDDFFGSGQHHDENDQEEEISGVYTPSTISPIPSPGRFYGQQGSLAEPSPSLDSTAFMLARSLLSPSNRPISSGSTTASHPAMSTGKTSRTPDNPAPSSGSSARGHARHRSGHGLLDYGLGHLGTKDATSAGSGGNGTTSGPNSAGHGSVQEGRRSRAESVLSTGSDIGGVIVPDITLMGSSFPNQSAIPLSTSEPFSQGAMMSAEGQDDHQENKSERAETYEPRSPMMSSSGVRRPPRRSATLGSQDQGRGSSSGSDTATRTNAGKHVNRSAQGDSRSHNAKGADVKLMPAPLPRSNQHYQRQQLEQRTSTGSLKVLVKEGSSVAAPPSSTGSSHVAFSPNTRADAPEATTGGGGTQHTHGASGGFEGFGRGMSGKTSSTTSSAAASEFGSGPSSPLTMNVTSANAILSNPSASSYSGFSALAALPVLSPSGSATTAQQYFTASHYHQSSPFRSAISHELTQEDDRASIRSRASNHRVGQETWRDGPDHSTTGAQIEAGQEDISQHLQSRQRGGSSSSSSRIYSISPSSHLASDSLVRRLEELQQHDHDQEERQKRLPSSPANTTTERDATLKTPGSTATHQDRPSFSSRASSATSVHQHRSPSANKTSWEDDHESHKRGKTRPGPGQGL